MNQILEKHIVEKTEAEENRSSKPWFDFLKLGILFGATFLSVYFTSITFNKLVFLVFLILAYRSKSDYIWLIWFFIINDAPGRLFSAGAVDDLRIPVYSITSGMTFIFQDLFLFMYLGKMILAKEKLNFVFKDAFKYFYIVIIILVPYSIFLGIDAGSFVMGLKYLLPWCWIIIVPYFIRDADLMIRASRLIFPFVFIGLALQIHSFIVGDYLDNILRGAEGRFNLMVEDKDMEYAARSWSDDYIKLFALIQALFFLASKNKSPHSSYYLGAVVICAVSSIFLSATRGWSISFGFLVITSVYIIAQNGHFQRIISLSFAALFLVLVLQWVFPPINRQFNAALERFSTIELLLEGDVTAGGTLKRIDVRGVRVLNQFYLSPILGWGISKYYFEYADGHVGLQNTLLNVGIIGFVYLNLLYLYLCIKIWEYSRRKKVRAMWGKGPLVYLFGMMAIFIIHGSSSQFWGYIMHFDHLDKVLTFSFVLAAFSAVINSSYEERSAGNDEEGQLKNSFL